MSEILPFVCGNCRFREFWSCICECDTSDDRGRYKRDDDEACGEWERIEEETVTIKYEDVCK